MLKLFYYLSLSFLLTCFSFTAWAQQEEDFRVYENFYKSQGTIYQKWLMHSGLGETLGVHSIEVEKEKLTLFLKFPYTDIDSILNAWQTLKADFDSVNVLSLEESLFYKMISITDIPQSAAVIQIYDTYDVYVEYCFKVKLFYDEFFKKEEEACKAIKRIIHFDPSDFSNLKEYSILNIDESICEEERSAQEIRILYPKAKVFQGIKNYAKQYYESTDCELRKPKLYLLDSKEILRFKVVDQCREVLKGENPKLCKVLRWFSHDCNWIKRERLIFTFTYEETPQGFTIGCMIDGAYGSGYHEEIQKGGYHNMEVDFDRELKDYADDFKEKIRELIKGL